MSDRRAMPEWQDELPTESGWYWFDGTMPYIQEFSGILCVYTTGTRLWVSLYGTEGNEDLDAFTGRWYGPITRPEENDDE